LVNLGNTVVVIEHNMDVIKNSDWLIDLGPEGGDEGGRVVSTGTPHDVAKAPGSYTGKYLLFLTIFLQNTTLKSKQLFKNMLIMQFRKP